MASKKKNTTSSSTAYKDYQSAYSQKPGEFSYKKKQPAWVDESNVKEYADALLNRKDFSFDVNENALYNQYKDIYQKQGNLAMMDRMGQAAALAGGYGSSYAASAGAQAYQQSLDKLTEKIPELYQLAMEQYQLEGQNLKDKYNTAYGEREASYGQYRDSVADWNTEREFSYGQYRDGVEDWQYNVDHLYGVYGDAVQNEQWAKEFAETQKVNDHNMKYDELNYQLATKELAESIRQFDKQYGLDSKKFEEQCKQWAKEFGLDADKLAETIRMNNWEIEQAGRSG